MKNCDSAPVFSRKSWHRKISDVQCLWLTITANKRNERCETQCNYDFVNNFANFLKSVKLATIHVVHFSIIYFQLISLVCVRCQLRRLLYEIHVSTVFAGTFWSFVIACTLIDILIFLCLPTLANCYHNIIKFKQITSLLLISTLF